MKTLTSALALTVALATTAAAGGLTASVAPQTRPHIDAHGCLVTAVIGRDGGILHTFATNPGRVECLIPEDGPELIEDDEVAAPVAPVDPVDPVEPEDEVAEPINPTGPGPGNGNGNGNGKPVRNG